MTSILQMRKEMWKGLVTCTGSPNWRVIELGLRTQTTLTDPLDRIPTQPFLTAFWTLEAELHSTRWPPWHGPSRLHLTWCCSTSKILKPLRIYILISTSIPSISSWSPNLFLILMVSICVLNSLFSSIYSLCSGFICYVRYIPSHVSNLLLITTWHLLPFLCSLISASALSSLI